MITAYRAYIERPRPPVERSCTSKSAFVSRRDAKSLARQGRHMDGTLQAYHCANCGLWHLGHKRRRR